MFQKCLKSLQKLKESPKRILKCKKNVFGEQLNGDDPVLEDLRNTVVSTDRLVTAVTCLAAAFISKLESQLKEYLTGALSAPSEDMLAVAASAPVHNMYAERTLGMMDALWRRAPNANLAFIDGKVKAIQNNTLEWLEDFSVDEQTSLIKFAVHHGAKMRALAATRKERTGEALVRKLAVVAQNRDRVSRNKCEKLIKEAISANKVLLALDIFSHLDSKVRDRLSRFLEDESSLLGCELVHTWHVNGIDTEYMERVRAVKTKKVGKNPAAKYICLTFWRVGTEHSDTDYQMPLVKFLADFALGDLTLA